MHLSFTFHIICLIMVYSKQHVKSISLSDIVSVFDPQICYRWSWRLLPGIHFYTKSMGTWRDGIPRGRTGYHCIPGRRPHPDSDFQIKCKRHETQRKWKHCDWEERKIRQHATGWGQDVQPTAITAGHTKHVLIRTLMTSRWYLTNNVVF